MELGTEGCHEEGIAYVRETIAEGHSHVPFLKVDMTTENAQHSLSEWGFEILKTYQAPAHIWDLPR